MLSDQYTIYLAVILFLLGIWFAARSKKVSFSAIFFMILAGYLLFQSFDGELFNFWPILILLFLFFIIRKINFSLKFMKLSSNKINESFTNNFNEIITGNFNGKKINGVITGGRLNLKTATIPAKGSTLYIDFIMGKYEVSVPEECNVKINFEKITGKIEDKRKKLNESPDTPVLYISGKTIIGELEIN